MAALGKEQIKQIIPQREPFLMIDEVLEIEPGKFVKALKHVKKDEYYFEGHFPSNPVMPGVLMVESIAQAGAVSLLSLPEHKGKIALFAGIDKVRFKRLVGPGETLEIEVECLEFRKGIGRAKGLIKIQDKIICRAEIMFALQ